VPSTAEVAREATNTAVGSAAKAVPTSSPAPNGQPPPNHVPSTTWSRYENAGGLMK
jgi:hypothetical protein